jgi:hypothetical protein
MGSDDARGLKILSSQSEDSESGYNEQKPDRITPSNGGLEDQDMQQVHTARGNVSVGETRAWQQVQEKSSYKTSPLSKITTCPRIWHSPNWRQRELFRPPILVV